MVLSIKKYGIRKKAFFLAALYQQTLSMIQVSTLTKLMEIFIGSNGIIITFCQWLQPTGS